MTSPLTAAWSQLRDHLERRSRALCDEVRHYPTPIAHCDEQLTGLIEQRTRALARVQRVMNLCGPDPIEVRAYLAATREDTDDEVESALRAQLEEALAAARELSR